MASFTAAGTAYATWGQPMIPFFIFYSMFGFQRVGDLIWAFGDQRGRGFLLGATAGRTTLTGEGLQHCDGQSQLLAMRGAELPRVRPRVRVRGGGDHPRRHRAHVRARARGLLLLPDALQRELRACRAMPEGVEDGIVRGLYRYRAAPEQRAHRAQILASGTMMLGALEAQQLLAEQHDVAADVWSATATSCSARTRSTASGGTGCTRPSAPRTPYVTEQLDERPRARSSRSPTT